MRRQISVKEKKVLVFIAQILAVYIVFVAYMYMRQKSFVYLAGDEYADTQTAALKDFTKITVRTADGLSIKGMYMPAKKNMPTIIYLHGNGGNIYMRGYLSEPYVAAGYGFLFAEYRGYGLNPGTPDEQGLYTDARAYMDWLIGDGNVAGRDIVMIGESIGTGVAVQMATEYPDIKALVLEAPFTSLPDVGQRRMPYLPVKWLATERFENIKKIGNIKMPLLVIHGEEDDTVPFKLGRKLFEAAPQPKKFLAIPKARHNNLFEFGDTQRIMHFVADHP